MKTLMSLVFLAQSAAFGVVSHGEDCRVSSVNESANPWEEGLGVFGDPDVDGDSQAVSFEGTRANVAAIGVGQMHWIIDTDDTIEVTVEKNVTKYLLGNVDSKSAVLLKVYPSERGIILYREKQSAKWQTIGTFDCSSVSEVEKASIRSSNVTKLGTAQVKKLPKSLRSNIDKVDLAVELGDGYYDLKASQLYAVNAKKDATQIVGYLLWAKLTYTEDNEDVVVLVRFDRNGLRLGEIEKQ